MREDAPRRKVSGTFVVTEGGLEPVLLRSLSRPQRTALGWSESTTKTAAKKKQNVQQFSSSLCFFSGSSSKKCRVYLACVRARTRAYIIRAVLVRVCCTSMITNAPTGRISDYSSYMAISVVLAHMRVRTIDTGTR